VGKEKSNKSFFFSAKGGKRGGSEKKGLSEKQASRDLMKKKKFKARPEPTGKGNGRIMLKGKKKLGTIKTIIIGDGKGHPGAKQSFMTGKRRGAFTARKERKVWFS